MRVPRVESLAWEARAPQRRVSPRTVRWTPSIPWSVAMGSTAAVSLLVMMMWQSKVFLYFQF